MRILVIENHEDTRSWLDAQLTSRGHDVTTACTYADAAELLLGFRWDAVICNIGLPDGSGWDLLARTGGSVDFLRIAMSGCGANADMERSRAAGFDYHLYKPFPLAYLERLIEEAKLHPLTRGKLPSPGPELCRSAGEGAPLGRGSA